MRENYTDDAAVTELISHGDMSSLGECVGSEHDFDDCESGSTTYYGRDRGEKCPSNKPKRRKSLEELVKYAENCGCEYFYLFDQGRWKYADRGMQFFGLSDGSPLSQLKSLT